MKVINIQLNDSTKPIRNNRFISTENVQHRDVSMEMVGDGNVSVIFPEPKVGHYFIPASSISWLQMGEVSSPVKKASRPKKKSLMKASSVEAA
tara:strand:- start:160 stop:438 length:279 start_codon:yes stop_codon:yes gene_type:complete